MLVEHCHTIGKELYHTELVVWTKCLVAWSPLYIMYNLCIYPMPLYTMVNVLYVTERVQLHEGFPTTELSIHAFYIVLSITNVLLLYYIAYILWHQAGTEAKWYMNNQLILVHVMGVPGQEASKTEPQWCDYDDICTAWQLRSFMHQYWAEIYKMSY